MHVIFDAHIVLHEHVYLHAAISHFKHQQLKKSNLLRVNRRCFNICLKNSELYMYIENQNILKHKRCRWDHWRLWSHISSEPASVSMDSMLFKIMTLGGGSGKGCIFFRKQASPLMNNADFWGGDFSQKNTSYIYFYVSPTIISTPVSTMYPRLSVRGSRI